MSDRGSVLFGWRICGTLAPRMPISRPQIAPRPIGGSCFRRRILHKPFPAMLCSLVLLGGSALPAVGNEARPSELAQAESELLRQLEEAQRLEVEAALREAEEQAAHARQVERERRERREQFRKTHLPAYRDNQI